MKMKKKENNWKSMVIIQCKEKTLSIVNSIFFFSFESASFALELEIPRALPTVDSMVMFKTMRHLTMSVTASAGISSKVDFLNILLETHSHYIVLKTGVVALDRMSHWKCSERIRKKMSLRKNQMQTHSQKFLYFWFLLLTSAGFWSCTHYANCKKKKICW